jgi:hypothetical protein
MASATFRMTSLTGVPNSRIANGSSQVAGSVTNGAAVAHIAGTCKGRVSEVAPRGTWRIGQAIFAAIGPWVKQNPRNLRHLGCNSQRWNQWFWGNLTFLSFQGRYSLPKQWRFCLFRKTDLGNHFLFDTYPEYTQYPHGVASFMYYGSSLPHCGIITESYVLSLSQLLLLKHNYLLLKHGHSTHLLQLTCWSIMKNLKIL